MMHTAPEASYARKIKKEKPLVLQSARRDFETSTVQTRYIVRNYIFPNKNYELFFNK